MFKKKHLLNPRYSAIGYCRAAPGIEFQSYIQKTSCVTLYIYYLGLARAIESKYNVSATAIRYRLEQGLHRNFSQKFREISHNFESFGSRQFREISVVFGNFGRRIFQNFTVDSAEVLNNSLIVPLKMCNFADFR